MLKMAPLSSWYEVLFIIICCCCFYNHCQFHTFTKVLANAWLNRTMNSHCFGKVHFVMLVFPRVISVFTLTEIIVHTSSLIFFWNVLVHSWWSHSQNFRLLLECKWTLGSLQCLRGQHYASVADGRWNTKLLTHFHIINPLTPKISSVILLIVCQTILIMLILRIWYRIN